MRVGGDDEDDVDSLTVATTSSSGDTVSAVGNDGCWGGRLVSLSLDIGSCVDGTFGVVEEEDSSPSSGTGKGKAEEGGAVVCWVGIGDEVEGREGVDELGTDQ